MAYLEDEEDAPNDEVDTHSNCKHQDEDDPDGTEGSFAPKDGEEPREESPGGGGARPSRFRKLDSEEVNHDASGGERKSARIERWALKAFDKWRTLMGHAASLSIGELSELPNVSIFVQLLHDFVLQVTIPDGSLYPPTS